MPVSFAQAHNRSGCHCSPMRIKSSCWSYFNERSISVETWSCSWMRSNSFAAVTRIVGGPVQPPCHSSCVKTIVRRALQICSPVSMKRSLCLGCGDVCKYFATTAFPLTHWFPASRGSFLRHTNLPASSVLKAASNWWTIRQAQSRISSKVSEKKKTLFTFCLHVSTLSTCLHDHGTMSLLVHGTVCDLVKACYVAKDGLAWTEASLCCWKTKVRFNWRAMWTYGQETTRDSTFISSKNP